jgi:hypothetical protein
MNITPAGGYYWRWGGADYPNDTDYFHPDHLLRGWIRRRTDGTYGGKIRDEDYTEFPTKEEAMRFVEVMVRMGEAS